MLRVALGTSLEQQWEYALSLHRVLSHLILTRPHEVREHIISIFQIKNLKVRDIKQFVKGHLARRCWMEPEFI